MKHLVYCVLRDARGPMRCILPAGVEGAEVLLVAEGGLAAACSVAPDGCAAPTVPRATAYARVIGALHAVTAVLPFRYGNFLDSSERVLNLLRVHRAEFLQSLEEVEGCDEMGLRILLENRPEHSVRAEHAPYTAHKNSVRAKHAPYTAHKNSVRAEHAPYTYKNPVRAEHAPYTHKNPVRAEHAPYTHKNPCRVGAVHPPSSSHTSPGLACAQPACAASGGTGREFLEDRRAHYATQECDEALAAQVVAETRSALEGLAVKCRAQRSSAPASPLGRVLSLFFLVRRENVERFREAFGQLQQETPAKMLLTGPWPPYNFVGSPCPDGCAERD